MKQKGPPRGGPFVSRVPADGSAGRLHYISAGACDAAYHAACQSALTACTVQLLAQSLVARGYVSAMSPDKWSLDLVRGGVLRHRVISHSRTPVNFPLAKVRLPFALIAT